MLDFFLKPLNHFCFSQSYLQINSIMKKITTLLFVVLAITFSFAQQSEETEHTGDNFSLEGALAMFKKASSLEDFEKILNQEDNNVNNLDLNNDGRIDYINVDDIKDNDTHVIVLSTYLKENEKQDIATIGIEKTAKDEASLQIEGDPDLYVENTIVEPFAGSDKLENSKGRPNVPEINSAGIFVNVWFWPCVSFVYAPAYVPWVSPNRWGFYPRWWRPWNPYRYNMFYARCAPHRMFFRPTLYRRMYVARRMYAPRRRMSVFVVHRNRNSNFRGNNRQNNRGQMRGNRGFGGKHRR